MHIAIAGAAVNLIKIKNNIVLPTVKILYRVRNAALYILRGDFSGFADSFRSYMQNESFYKIQLAANKPDNQKFWCIMATQHTLFIAHIIAERLRSHGMKVEIMTDPPAGFPHDWYVVICPQIFKKIPPSRKRFVFQMEQSVSPRWFTKRYIKMLENSLGMFEYALHNVEYLARNSSIAYPHVYYLPIGASATYGNPIPTFEKVCDILFYGDVNSSARRRKMLDALSQHFKVHVVNDMFGHDMLKAIRQARVVLNLHYYENGILEMPRIQECLSLGVPVVSEAAQDQGDYPELAGAVQFFEQGSIPAMLKAVKRALDVPVAPEIIEKSVSSSAKRFEFMFDRFLVAMGFLPATHVSHMILPLPDTVNRVALSLPETIGRRRSFEVERPRDCIIFDGIRRRPGWIGCGLSYLALAHHALKHGIQSLTVMEDDVVLPPDFEKKMAVIHDFLIKRSGQWDVFAGVIASLHPQAKILSTEVYEGITFVTIDKMTSTVFNIYSEKALRLFASWNPEDLDVESNTIDRFLERQADLRIVVTIPFFVGHREEVYSTLWGSHNTQYLDMISTSERMLRDMIVAQLDQT